jgi:hypothetical protein
LFLVVLCVDLCIVACCGLYISLRLRPLTLSFFWFNIFLRRLTVVHHFFFQIIRAIHHHATTQHIVISDDHLFRAVSGLHLRGRQATLWTRQDLVLAFTDPQQPGKTFYIEPLRFVDTRKRGEPPITWAVGFELMEREARLSLAENHIVLERKPRKLFFAVPVGGTDIVVRRDRLII